ncbi:F-box and WD-40 domain-containing protein MET30 [Exophiala aquamarina CBS 119918]|uniref:Probable E3 ubiquitin ligase complex SCF subunit sconB n=1 Tax=Exophiala aquamarina CBS 119918 TaxID=1182545 RepID=A0A072NXC3_9EURO|nr:F-box and WD-40 domain-containing protein MET30 [Exophiala aquamarina CBS 119918]KEF52524.1 F-box and WD-40 domain-containing protein MET30 [Exophiala aquamarina CBS 119918]
MTEKHRRQSLVHDEWNEAARKRLRVTPTRDDYHDNHDHDAITDSAKDFTIASTAKHARETVAPFLAKHIPAQYAPLGQSNAPQPSFKARKDTNSKFCYRHRPDKLCRRQVDEPSMEKLQHDLESLDQQDRQGIVQVWSLFSAAPSKYRNLMLKGILAQCCFPQLSFLSANVRELIRIDFLSALPSEVSFRILCFLDTTSLCKAAQVSRKWRQLADDDVVWHRMCEQHIDRKCTQCGWGLPLLERKLLRSSKRQIELRAAGIAAEGFAYTGADSQERGQSSAPLDNDSLSEATVVEDPQTEAASPMVLRRPRFGTSDSEQLRATRPWKDVYKDRFKVGTNWKYGRCSIDILKGHSNGVMTLQLFDNFLATGSYDATIKIWNIETGEELKTLRGHTMGIRCLQFDENKLISGSLDKSLKVWNWRTGECISTFNGHSEGVIALHFDSDILVSGSVDNTARVWNFRDKSVFTLRGHTDWINSVKIDSSSRTIFTASDDCTVKLWDLDRKKCIHTFEGHVGQVQTVLPLPAEFEVEECQVEDDDECSEPESPHSQSTTESTYGGFKIMTNRERHINLFANESHRPQPPRYMITSALDSTIRLWDVHSGRCIKKFFGHVEGVWAVAADTLRIVSGAEDRMVKIWDPRTGKCERTFTGHAGPVTCIALSESRMVSGGEDGEVRVYNFTA